MTANAVAAAIAAALAAVATDTTVATDTAVVTDTTVDEEKKVGPSSEQLTTTPGPTDAEVAKWLSSPGAQALFAVGPGVSQLTSGGGTTININSTAVSGQEVVEALGAHVDMNGPLPPHWQQGAQ